MFTCSALLVCVWCPFKYRCIGSEECGILGCLDPVHVTETCMAYLWWMSFVIVIVYVNVVTCCNKSLWCSVCLMQLSTPSSEPFPAHSAVFCQLFGMVFCHLWFVHPMASLQSQENESRSELSLHVLLKCSRFHITNAYHGRFGLALSKVYMRVCKTAHRVILIFICAAVQFEIVYCAVLLLWLPRL